MAKGKRLTMIEEQEIIKAYVETEETISDIAKRYHKRFYTIRQVIVKILGEGAITERHKALLSLQKLRDNPMQGKFGTLHPNYKGRVEDGKGYIMVLKPEWYTGRKGSKHVYEHSVIMCELLNITEIPKGFCIHHIDGDTRNNNANNLALLTMEAHQRLHSVMCRDHPEWE